MKKILKIKKIIIIKILNIFSNLIDNKNIIKIFNNFLLKKKNNFIYFISNNSNLQIKIKYKLKKISKSILIWIPIRDFLSIIKSFPNGDIYIELSSKKKLNVISSKIRFNLKTFLYLDYPLMKMKKYKLKLEINKIELLNLINYVYFSVDKEKDNYSINGILMSIEKDKITTISTDNYRLSLFSLNILKKNIKNKKIIIPLKTITLLKNLLEKEETNVIKIKISKNNIKFTFKNIEIISKLIKDNFPILKEKLYKIYKYNFIINRNDLKLALKRSCNIINNKFKAARFLIKKNILKIITNSENKNGLEKFNINYDFNNVIDVSININYIKELIENIKNEQLKFNFSKNLKKIIITIPDLENFKYIMTTLKN